MRLSLLIVPLIVVLFLGSLAAVEQRIEAEAGTVATAVDAEWAWGGRAAETGGAWQPLLSIAWPEKAPTGEVFIWLRHRYGPVCLKALTADGQRELGWAWGTPEEFAYARLGPFPATTFAGGLLVIRNNVDAGRPATQLDAIVISDRDTMPEDPPLAPRPTPALIRIDWKAPTGATTGTSYGLNLFHAFDPVVLADPRYRAGLAAMAPRFIRLHHAGQVNSSSDSAGLWDPSTRGLDHAKIARLCPLWRGLAPELLMNISGWPAWMDADSDGRLDESSIADFAAQCADLVRQVNVIGKVGIRWWEPTNERDGAYWMHDRLPADPAALGRIHAACAEAMRAIDPDIRVGGPAASRPDKVDGLVAFARAAGPTLDFLSWHAYASGSAADSDRQLLDRVAVIARESRDLSERVRTALGRPDLPGLLDEYNISWTWETRDARMTDQFSAVFDALMMIAAARHGVNGTAAWNECDGIYGKMDNGFQLRPAAEVFRRCNRDLVGAVATVAADPDAPDCLPVQRADGTRAVMLVNRDRRAVTVRLPGGIQGKATLAIIARGTCDERAVDGADLERGVELPGRSVAWIVGQTP